MRGPLLECTACSSQALALFQRLAYNHLLHFGLLSLPRKRTSSLSGASNLRGSWDKRNSTRSCAGWRSFIVQPHTACPIPCSNVALITTSDLRYLAFHLLQRDMCRAVFIADCTYAKERDLTTSRSNAIRITWWHGRHITYIALTTLETTQALISILAALTSWKNRVRQGRSTLNQASAQRLLLSRQWPTRSSPQWIAL